MKKLFTLFCLLSIMTVAGAQNTRIIKGSVEDKQGNPLAGAKVEATHGAVYTTTDDKGNFILEIPIWLESITATHDGYHYKKLKANKNEYNFKMKKQLNWFLNIEQSLGFGDEFAYGIGFRTGFIREWGAYLKAITYIPTGYQTKARPSVTLGTSKRMTNHLHIYLGAGYAPVYGTQDSSEANPEDYAEDGVQMETGIIGHLKHFNINVGYGLTVGENAHINHALQIGLGYVF